MKKLILSLTGMGIVIALVLASCQKEESKIKSQEVAIESNELPIFHNDLSSKELDVIFSSDYNEKAAKPPKKKKRIKFSFTFGGFEACKGGANCGSCPGICFQFLPAPTDDTLTGEELLRGFGLADVAIIPPALESEDFLLLIKPDRSMDNGDGYVRINNDTYLGDQFSEYVEHSCTVQEGQYEINFDNGNEYGVVALHLK